MKKQLFLAATAAIILASCSSESVDFTQADVASQQNNAPTAIEFGTYLGKTGTTRAGSTGAISSAQILAKKGGFGVFAYNTGSSTLTSGSTFTTYKPDFMYNQLISGTDVATPVWSYSPKKYWPNGTDTGGTVSSTSNSKSASESGIQYLSFFAYAPYVSSVSSSAGITAMSANTTTGAPTVTYTFASGDYTAASNVDLMWGLRGTTPYNETDGSTSTGTVGTDYNVNLTKQIVGETVDFTFKHALAAIDDIQAVLDVDAKGSAGTTGAGSLTTSETTVTIQNITIAAASASSFATSATFNLATGAWSSPSNAAADAVFINVTPSTTNKNTFIASASDTKQSTSGTWDFEGVPTGTAASIYTSGNFPVFYIIPQSSSQLLKVSVTYIIKTADSKLDGGYNTTSQTITNNVTIPSFAVNTKYKLVLHLGLTSINFSATVTNWATGSTETVWLPSNVISGS